MSFPATPTLFAEQVRYQLLTFARSPVGMFFTLGLPVLMLVLFNALFGGETVETPHGEFQVRKHTITVNPAQKISYAVTADAIGRWAYHCHLLYHMEAGMFREVEVAPEGEHRGDHE